MLVCFSQVWRSDANDSIDGASVCEMHEREVTPARGHTS